MTDRILTEAELAEIEARTAAATEGPWAWEQYGEKENCYHIGVACDKKGEPVLGKTETMPYDEDKDMFVEDILWGSQIGELEGATVNYDDAEFISHARTDVPILIASHRRLQQQVAELEAATSHDSGMERTREVHG